MDLKVNDKVLYLGTPATILAVKKNGVKIGYWGMGLQEDKYVTRRVSASYLSKA